MYIYVYIMDYRTKYLKYKNKYLELKREISGGLRVDDKGREIWESTLALPEKINDINVQKIYRYIKVDNS